MLECVEYSLEWLYNVWKIKWNVLNLWNDILMLLMCIDIAPFFHFSWVSFTVTSSWRTFSWIPQVTSSSQTLASVKSSYLMKRSVLEKHNLGEYWWVGHQRCNCLISLSVLKWTGSEWLYWCKLYLYKEKYIRHSYHWVDVIFKNQRTRFIAQWNYTYIYYIYWWRSAKLFLLHC